MSTNNTQRNEFKQLGMELLQRFLPFADAATDDLPLPRLLRLSLFQISVGAAIVLLNGTLNRVMVVELGMPVWVVSLMVALPLVFAPLRALIGHRSDYHRSAFGLRRVPYIWWGTALQFGGFTFMPFALLLLSDPGNNAAAVGYVAAAVAFLFVGAGLHTTQTAGLALATDLAPVEARPRVVALLYVTLLLGMMLSAILYGLFLQDFDQVRLVQVIQATAAMTVALNLVALWRQEAIDRKRAANPVRAPKFSATWKAFIKDRYAARLLVVVGLGTAAFSMQDILLEPYGGEVLGLTVSQTTLLTAIWAGGTLIAFSLAGWLLTKGGNPNRMAAIGAALGLFAFVAVIVAGLLSMPWLFRTGAGLIGFGGGLFAVGTLTAAMGLAQGGHTGLALGAWGAVQATAQGGAIFLGGAIRDLVSMMVHKGWFGGEMSGPAFSYGVVYHLEIILLLATLVVVFPLMRKKNQPDLDAPKKFGISEML
ncbi:BCD family MFS transporter [Thiorhodovibrio frisius]|uniref:Arabinose efflux permease family protein n=1 Tax=Thiorhodovibrio frisius TaxID=631362 RepID=H8Z4Q0_9GAMM|nr:BCD family MFS transporter [Thiorhodovibrio frisius]EIC20307.1 arabinose efflux permease family protein [Thiorhodovibrio frisius]WPL21045.1 PucC protein [Thiorhodovibrio frisius]